MWDGDAVRIKKLLDQGADPNDTDYFNRDRSALMYAAGSGRLDIIEMLIQHGARVNARDAHGFSALNWTKDPETIALLKRHGAR